MEGQGGVRNTTLATPSPWPIPSLVKTAVTVTLDDEAATTQGSGGVVPVAVHSSDAGAEGHVLEPVYEPV